MKEGECVLVIIGNKIDLERQRTVTQKEAEDYAATVGAQHFHTSAKLNKGLEETFVGLTRRMMEVRKKTSARPQKKLRCHFVLFSLPLGVSRRRSGKEEHGSVGSRSRSRRRGRNRHPKIRMRMLERKKKKKKN